MSPGVSVHSASRYVFPCGEQLLLLQARVAVSFPVGNDCFFSRCGRRVVFRGSALLGWHVFPFGELLLLSRHGRRWNSPCGITASSVFLSGVCSGFWRTPQVWVHYARRFVFLCGK